MLALLQVTTCTCMLQIQHQPMLVFPSAFVLVSTGLKPRPSHSAPFVLVSMGTKRAARIHVERLNFHRLKSLHVRRPWYDTKSPLQFWLLINMMLHMETVCILSRTSRCLYM